MKTLNKTLSLILALAMVFGLMGVASASFTDQDKITHTTAVNTCVALNIINGYSDGTYGPSGLVTRAELCKMICIAYNGGVAPTLATTTNPSYTDTGSNWASAYIEYCTKLGIVAGTGDGKFDPDGTVTGTQAAKMMLVALGYSAANESFTGTNWDVAVNVRANEKKLYDGLVSFDPATGLNRDNAAQMIYNMLQAQEVEYSYSITTDANGAVKTTPVLKDKAASDGTKAAYVFQTDKYGLKSETGIFTNESYSSTTKKYTITTTYGTNPTYISSTDFSQYFRMNVKILYKLDSDNNKVVYGVVPVNSTIVASGAFGTIAEAYIGATDTATQFTSDAGTVYKLDSTYTLATLPRYNFNVVAAAGALSDAEAVANAAYSYEFIDNTGDGKIDCVVFYPYTVQKVTALSSSTITTKYATYFGGTTAFDAESLDNLDTYTGIAKSDYVKVTAAVNTVTGTPKLEKIAAMSGTVSKTKTVSLSGVTLQKAYVSEASTWLMNATGTAAELAAYTNVIQVNGFIFAATKGSSITSANQYALMTYAGPSAGDNVVKLVFSDGTSKVVTASKDYTSNAPVWSTSIPSGTDFTKGPQLVTYKVSSTTGAYTLTLASRTAGTSNQDPYDITLAAGSTYTYSTSGSTIGAYKIADDAVIFAHAADNSSTKVITGAVLKTLASTAVVRVNNAYANTDSSTGYSTIALASVELQNTIAGTKTYGYVTEINTASVNDASGYEVVIWNGSSKSLTTAAADKPAGLAVGDVVSYSINSDGTYTIVKETVHKGAITALSGTNVQISDENGNKETSSVSTSINSTTTTVFGVNSKKKTGSADADLAMAQTTAAGKYIDNVLYIDGDDADHAFALIIIDNTNQSVATVTASSFSEATFANLADDFAKYDVVTFTGTDATAITVPYGRTLNISGINAGITTITNKGTINMNAACTTSGTVTNNGTINVVTGNSVFASLTGTGKVAVTSQLTVTAAATVAVLDNITGVTAASSKLITGAASSDTKTTASTTYYTAASTAVAASTAIPADTYTWKPYDGGTGTNAWVK